MASVVKDEIFKDKPKAPFQTFGVELSIADEGQGQGQVQDLFVYEGDIVVVPSHEAIRNIMSIHALFRLVRGVLLDEMRYSLCSLGVGVTKTHQTFNHSFPWYSLKISIGNAEQVVIEFV